MINETLARLWRTPAESTLGAIFFSAMSFMFKTEYIFYLLTAALVLDTLTGLSCAVKRGQAIQSKILCRSMFEKMLGYGSVLLITSGIDNFMKDLGIGLDGGIFLHALAIGWVFATEGISLLENSQVLLGVKIPFLTPVKKLSNMISSEVEKQVPDKVEPPPCD